MSQISATDERYRVQLFGGPRLFSGPQEVPLSPHQSCLVGLLFGTEEAGLARGKAISFLWQEEEPLRARRRLSQLLYSLKHKVGLEPLFDTHGDEIRKAGEGVHTDLAVYAMALAARDFPTCAEFLLKGFASKSIGAVNRRFDDWAKAKEAELRREVRRGAEHNWHRCVSEEDWDGARSAAEALLGLAPQNEDRLRKVMEARAKSGWKTGAEEAFKDFESRLVKRSWVPEKETSALLVTIQGMPAHQPAFLASGTDGKSVEPPMLGRDQEMRTIRKALRNAPTKDLRGFLVLGEAGIGKTRMIHESLLGLGFDGQLILTAESAEMEQLIPLNPLIEVLKGPEVGGALRQLDEPWRTVLFGVMPSHFVGDGPIPEAPHIQPGSVPRRLFEAFYQLLLALTKDRSLILVLEDLQWADETTLSVLEFLIRRWDHGNLQLMVSARAEEVRRHPVLGRFLETLRVHQDIVEVHLTELEPPDSEALIRQLAAKPLEADQVSQLRSLAGGNPFFLIELTLEFVAGRLGPVVTPQDLVPIPVSIRQVLDRRLTQLSSNAERVLGSLAVFSRPLDLPDLVRIAHLSRPKCLSGLDQLHHFRLVTSRGAEVTVCHELVRQTVYQSMNSTRRAWLHDRIARHLLRNRKAAPPDELAVHFHHAGASAEARVFAIETADRAEASGAIPEALRFLRIAREHSSEPEQVVDLIWRIGHLNYLHQNLEEAAPFLELAAQRFRRHGDRTRALSAEVERIDCLAQGGQLPLSECLEELNRIKTETESRQEWTTYTKALDVEVHRLDHRGDHAGVQRVLEDARRCSVLGGPDARCRARAVMALNVYYGSPTDALVAAREAVSVALNTDDTDLQLHALNRLIVVLLYQGKLHSSEGQHLFQLAESRLNRSGDLILKFFIRLNRAVWHLEVGELDLAQQAFTKVAPVIRGSKAADAHAMLFLNEGELGLALFDIPSARMNYRRAETYLRPCSPKAFETIINAGLGMCALNVGDLADARRRENELPPFPDCWTFDPSVVVTFKASMLKRRGDHSAAERLLNDVAEDVRERLVTAWIKLSMERARILRKEQPDEAITVLKEVLSVVAELGLSHRKTELERSLSRS